jgi:hypothetical protein
MLRRFSHAMGLLVIAGGLYAVTPFVAVWQIREAVIAGDVTTLEHKVDWASVRRTLKQSGGDVRAAMLEYSQAAGIPKPGLWQRIKAAAAPMFADPLIDRYVTAEGAPQIYAWRQTWRETVRPAVGLSDPPTVLAGTKLADTKLDRAFSLARRVQRAAFVGPRKVEIEVRDQFKDNRRWRAVLELQGVSWRLIEVGLRHDRPTTPPALFARN